ncbi:TlpA disulfide reductase family protein [Flavivirga abyssicola]|uniref:TlpA family protein disulfide reductase n=1 Tax=Flavivirga abyssicola TaxID=3063533 RepID=UPI0026DF13DC|nr:TlpA disulfide reductase family protein [Flavivirga sp. MEBiC07777]WVK12013.1 TlpA disulfide reductase family protein [Flavivirga sp. MEBiC07777]
MRKIIYPLITVLLLLSCNKQNPKTYVTLSGTITNQKADSIVVLDLRKGGIKTIKVNDKGEYSDTLKVEPGLHALFDGSNLKDLPFIYLKNGYHLKTTVDAENYKTSIKHKGIGEEANNYLVKVAEMENRNGFALNKKLEELFVLNNTDFEKEVMIRFQDLENLLKNTPNIDSFLIKKETTKFKKRLNYIKKLYNGKQLSSNMKGKPSPKFVNYENYAGGTNSLDDFKGKYVFIDLWATWCGPCIQQIPYLEKIEKKYHGKNIVFISISTDKLSDYDKWKKMVKEKGLTGIQLYAKGDESFKKEYGITSIPRFILIDPNGTIIDANAPKPSDNKLTQLIDGLDI